MLLTDTIRSEPILVTGRDAEQLALIDMECLKVLSYTRYDRGGRLYFVYERCKQPFV